MRNKLRLSIRVIVITLAFVSTLWATDSAQSAWNDFRNRFSYHIQTIALFNHRYLLISEPPPHVTMEGLISLAPSLLNDPRTFDHPMGVDGWVRDVVFELPEMDNQKLADLIDTIQLYVFGTTYKAETLHLPQSPSAEANSGVAANLDLRVSAADIHRWIMSENERFSKVGRIAGFPPSLLLNSGETGVYYSRKPGLVLWVLPRSLDITKRRREARQFAVDSDLILGAIYSPSRVAILARERILPSTVLPPLRYETMELLASVPRRNLAQSYERNYILSGRIDKDRNDWAPIYLSPELIDTEYGSLLNLTDQMLKSWTEAGFVRYTNFKYPDPKSFPFGEMGLLRIERSVVYNWNTTGVGYKAALSAYPIFALNRTGSLAVSYISGQNQRLAEKEERAYNYFAQLNNADLARVVQYAALYQIFCDVRSRDFLTAPSEPENPAVRAMIKVTSDTLSTVRDVDFSDRVDSSTVEGAQFLLDLQACRRQLLSIGRIYGDEGIKYIAERLAAFRNGRESLSLLQQSARETPLPPGVADRAITGCRESVRQIGGRQMRTRAFDEYRKAWVRPGSGWVHTASVVVSHWATPEVDNYTLVGGHNLYSKTTKLREDPLLPAGKVSILQENNEVVIVHSRFDRAKAHALVRVAARELEHPVVTKLSLRSALEGELFHTNVVQQTRIEALHYQRFSSGSRAFQRSSLNELDQGAVRSGTQFSSQDIPSGIRDVIASPGHVVVLKNATGTYQLMFDGLANPLEVKSMPALVDQMLDPANLKSGTSQMQLHLAGFTSEEADGFLKNVEFQMRRQANESSVLTGVVEKDGNVTSGVMNELNTQFDFSKATLSEPRLTIIEDGPQQGSHLFEARLEIPARVALRPSIWMKIRIFFSEKLSQTLSSAIYRSLDSIRASLGNERATLNVQARRLKREIIRICPDAKRVELELNNFSITERLDVPLGNQLLPKSA